MSDTFSISRTSRTVDNVGISQSEEYYYTNSKSEKMSRSVCGRTWINCESFSFKNIADAFTNCIRRMKKSENTSHVISEIPSDKPTIKPAEEQFIPAIGHGIDNPGYFCYINSVIQALRLLPELQQMLVESIEQIPEPINICDELHNKLSWLYNKSSREVVFSKQPFHRSISERKLTYNFFKTVVKKVVNSGCQLVLSVEEKKELKNFITHYYRERLLEVFQNASSSIVVSTDIIDDFCNLSKLLGFDTKAWRQEDAQEFLMFMLENLDFKNFKFINRSVDTLGNSKTSEPKQSNSLLLTVDPQCRTIQELISFNRTDEELNVVETLVSLCNQHISNDQPKELKLLNKHLKTLQQGLEGQVFYKHNPLYEILNTIYTNNNFEKFKENVLKLQGNNLLLPLLKRVRDSKGEIREKDSIYVCKEVQRIKKDFVLKGIIIDTDILYSKDLKAISREIERIESFQLVLKYKKETAIYLSESPPTFLPIVLGRFSSITDEQGCIITEKNFAKIYPNSLLEIPFESGGFARYKLQGVVLHQGRSIDSGHYFTYSNVKDTISEKESLFFFDDNKVGKLSHLPEDVEQIGYLFFYALIERVE